jgi:hypothetical protein
MPDSKEIIEIKNRIKELEDQLADLEARLPAHSIPPNLVAEMDRLDEQIQAENERLGKLRSEENRG